jgi:hypothetical protein
MFDILTAPDGTYTLEGKPVSHTFGYYVGLNGETRAFNNAKLIGIWTGPDGVRYVDRSRLVATLAKALKLAKSHEQIAIWDCANEEEIYV